MGVALTGEDLIDRVQDKLLELGFRLCAQLLLGRESTGVEAREAHALLEVTNIHIFHPFIFSGNRVSVVAAVETKLLARRSIGGSDLRRGSHVRRRPHAATDLLTSRTRGR